VAMTLEPASEGDTTTIHKTLAEAQAAVTKSVSGSRRGGRRKGYPRGAVLAKIHKREVRSYIPEPEAGGGSGRARAKAEEQQRTYENRRRVRENATGGYRNCAAN